MNVSALPRSSPPPVRWHETPGITCVCDDSGRIYKCFPELKSEQKAGRGGQAGDPSQGALEVFRGEQGDQGGDHLDRR